MLLSTKTQYEMCDNRIVSQRFETATRKWHIGIKNQHRHAKG